MPDDKLIFEKRVPYTIVRNEVFDEVMPRVSYPAWKVLSAIIRATMGWQKLEDQLSYSQLLRRTGIKSRSTLTQAIKELETGNYIVRRAMGNGQEPNAYALNDKYVLLSTSTEDELGSGTEDELPLVREMDSQKKYSKENTTTLSGSTRADTVPRSDTAHHRLVAWYIDQIAPGYAKRYSGKFAGDCKAIKAMLSRDHEEGTIQDCYRSFKSEPFWARQHLSMQRIDENIDDWKRAGGKRGSHKQAAKTKYSHFDEVAAERQAARDAAD